MTHEKLRHEFDWKIRRFGWERLWGHRRDSTAFSRQSKDNFVWVTADVEPCAGNPFGRGVALASNKVLGPLSNRLNQTVMKTVRTHLEILDLLLLLTVPLGLSDCVLGAEKSPARFEGKDALLRPEGYREWVFVGSSLGLQYNPKDEKSESTSMEYKNVYINPSAYREYSNSGKFPEGTVLVLETASTETKKEPGLQGSFQKEYIGLSAAVKDSKRFPDGWAYFRFSDGSGKPRAKSNPSAKESCYDCHRQKAATDNVFTQFYPVLRAAAKR